MVIFRTIAKISQIYCWGILIWATLYIGRTRNITIHYIQWTKQHSTNGSIAFPDVRRPSLATPISSDLGLERTGWTVRLVTQKVPNEF